jgi:endonuclease/exonuclease/phosphatase family metal-dependent hydrolase
LSGVPLDDGAYLQVNRSLEEEFTELIAGAPWAVCLLQEAPPAWAPRLGALCGAEVFRSLTSRNQFAFITRPLGNWRPDLLGSWEGGSNVILVRAPWKIVPGSTRSLLLSSLRERGLAERRRMSFVRLRSDDGPGKVEVCIANLHATVCGQVQTERELRRAAKAALSWAGESPLVFGGDFNLRPQSSHLFDELEREFGLGGSTAPSAIDHLLVRGLELIRPAERWSNERRELEVSWKSGRRRIRLSDHSPVETEVRTSFQKLPMRYK